MEKYSPITYAPSKKFRVDLVRSIFCVLRTLAAFVLVVTPASAQATPHFWDHLKIGLDYRRDEVIVEVAESRESIQYERSGAQWKDRVARGLRTPEASELFELAAHLGCTLVKKLGTLPFYEFRISSKFTPTQICEAFQQDTRLVKEAEPNGISHQLYTPYSFPNDTYYQGGSQWNIAITQLDLAWNTSTGGMNLWSQGIPSVEIAIIDTGILSTHQDLAGKVLTGYCVLDGTTNTTDTDGHGTEVASIASVLTDNGLGIAGGSINSTLLPVKMDDSGAGSSADSAIGIDWATNNGAAVVNMSYGSTTSYSAEQAAVNEAYQSGVILVAASGNSGALQTLYPAGYPNVMAVGSSDSTDIWTTYSNYGPDMFCVSPSGLTGIETCDYESNSTYNVWAGTSMAAPGVSGLAAILLSNGIPFYECVSRIAATCDKIDSSSYPYVTTTGYPLGTWNNHLGYGRINDYRAMCTLVPPILNTASAAVGSVVLGWTAPGLSDAGIAGYDVFRSASVGGPFVEVNAAPVTGTTYTDGSVSSGQTWYYLVRGVDNNPEGFLTKASNVMSVTIPFPSPTITPTFTISPTSSATPTITVTSTFSGTFTASPTSTVTVTASASPTSTCTPSITPTWSPSQTIPGRLDSVIVYPNPANDSVWLAFPPRGQTVSVMIFALDGEKVAAFSATDMEAQDGLIHWNASGNRLASGIYLVFLEEDGRRFSTKLAIVKSGYGKSSWIAPGWLVSPPSR